VQSINDETDKIQEAALHKTGAASFWSIKFA